LKDDPKNVRVRGSLLSRKKKRERTGPPDRFCRQEGGKKEKKGQIAAYSGHEEGEKKKRTSGGRLTWGRSGKEKGTETRFFCINSWREGREKKAPFLFLARGKRDATFGSLGKGRGRKREVKLISLFSQRGRIRPPCFLTGGKATCSPS